MFIPSIANGLHGSRTAAQPHCDPWRCLLHWGTRGCAHTTERLHPDRGGRYTTQAERGPKNGVSAKQLENIMIVFIKLSVILTGTSSPTRKHCLHRTTARVTPVEKHAPTNELISDMSCGVYVRVVLRCTWLPFSAPGGL